MQISNCKFESSEIPQEKRNQSIKKGNKLIKTYWRQRDLHNSRNNLNNHLEIYGIHSGKKMLEHNMGDTVNTRHLLVNV